MTRTTSGLLTVIVAGLGLSASLVAQDSEVIVLDPNHPVIQAPGTVSAPGGAASLASPSGEVPEVVPLPAQGVNAHEVLSGLWFRYRVLAQHGDAEQAGRQIATALAFMRREGLRASPEIAAALMAEARRHHLEGDYRGARDSYALAARFAPELPDPHFGLAFALLRGDRDLPGAFGEWWAGLRAFARDPESIYNLAGNGLLVLFLGLQAGALLGLTLLSLRNAPALFHDLQEHSSGKLTEESARLLGWAILALPIMIPIPVAWAVALWSALFATYCRGNEKAATLLLLLLLAATGPVAHILNWHFGTAADPAARALIQAVREGPDLQHEEVLKRLVQEHPDEPIFPFLLASAYRTGGRFDEAILAYRRAIEIDPRDARAMVNLGNLHALRQEFAVSQTFYRKAVETDPHLALAHYNSHLAHLEAFHLEAADQELRDARKIDDVLVTSLIAEAAAGGGKRSPQDTTYSSKEIWMRALRLRLEGGLRREVKGAVTTPATLAGTAGLILALILPGLGIVPRKGAARRCLRCGRPYCRRCQMTIKYPDVCSQCMHLFILRDGLAPGVKNRKMEEVIRHRRRIFVGARLLSLALPGSGHILGGRVLLGIGLLAGWCTAWIGLGLRGRLMVTPESLASASTPETLLPYFVLAFLAWLAGNLLSHSAAGD